MSGPGGGQFWAGPEPSAVPAALTALASVYTVAMGRPVTTRRIWLDSADWRLYRKGMALTATASADSDEYTLELSSADGATVTAGPDTLGWPRLLAGLPDQLRPRLEPVLGVRALLPVVQASGTSVAGRLLDAEGKTVLRLVHERPATISGSRDRLPGRLWLIPLRGYAAVGERADRIVHGAGLVRDDRSGYPAALRAAGFDPDATSRPVMQPDLPAGVAVARVLLSFLGELEAAWDGTVADIDIEFLHDFRVAVRRSRSAVKLLGDVLPPALVAWVTPQLKWLGDLTTPSRDLDVLLQELPSLTARLTSGRPEDLEPLALHLTRLRDGRAAQAGARLAVGAVRAVARPMAGLPAGAGHLGRAAARRTHRGRGRRGTARHRRSSRAPPRLTDHARLARRGPAQPAQAVQGAALPAGGLRPAAGPGRRARRRQGAQDLAGRPRNVPGQRDAAGGGLRTRRRHDGPRRTPPPRRFSRWGRSRPGCRRTRTRHARSSPPRSSGSRGGRCSA